MRDDAREPAATHAAVAERVRARTAEDLTALFAGHDVCCTIAVDLEQALQDPHFAARAVFARRLMAGEKSISALPVPVAQGFRSKQQQIGYPALGEANDVLTSRRNPLA